MGKPNERDPPSLRLPMGYPCDICERHKNCINCQLTERGFCLEAIEQHHAAYARIQVEADIYAGQAAQFEERAETAETKARQLASDLDTATGLAEARLVKIDELEAEDSFWAEQVGDMKARGQDAEAEVKTLTDAARAAKALDVQRAARLREIEADMKEIQRRQNEAKLDAPVATAPRRTSAAPQAILIAALALILLFGGGMVGYYWLGIPFFSFFTWRVVAVIAVACGALGAIATLAAEMQTGGHPARISL